LTQPLYAFDATSGAGFFLEGSGRLSMNAAEGDTTFFTEALAFLGSRPLRF
jgi:hypothetical protein